MQRSSDTNSVTQIYKSCNKQRPLTSKNRPGTLKQIQESFLLQQSPQSKIEGAVSSHVPQVPIFKCNSFRKSGPALSEYPSSALLEVAQSAASSRDTKPVSSVVHGAAVTTLFKEHHSRNNAFRTSGTSNHILLESGAGASCTNRSIEKPLLLQQLPLQL